MIEKAYSGFDITLSCFLLIKGTVGTLKCHEIYLRFKEN